MKGSCLRCQGDP
uniref:Soluble inorganic pyrophosphatase n=1 Tax=Arundo donax TaxID=35708 RepID=A0A0A9DFQ4_ARUDO